MARYWFFSPRLLESRALTPTPVPMPTANIRFCSEKARETAVRAFSLTRATKIESTTLYSACTSMEIIIGMLSLISSGLTSMVPMIFSDSERLSCLFSTISPFDVE